MALAIDPGTKDLVLESGQFVQVSGLTHVGFRVRDRLFTFKNEWFLDLSFGVPYLTDILGKKGLNLAAINAIFKAEIRKSLEDEANLTAAQLLFDSSTRELKGSFILTNADEEPFQDQFLL